MSSLNDRLPLMRYLIDANKDETDEKMEKFEFKLEKIVSRFDHMLHHNQISSPENYVEDDGISEITKSTSKTNPSKSELSNFRITTQTINVDHF